MEKKKKVLMKKELSKSDLWIIKFFHDGGKVLEDGTVISLKGKELKPYITTNDGKHKQRYCFYQICINGKSINIRGHRLQAFSKYGYKMFERGIMVRHLDGNGINNHINNIGIGTWHDNRNDMTEEEIRIMKENMSKGKVKRNEK